MFLFSYNWNTGSCQKKKQEKSEDLTSQEKEEGDKSQANQDLVDFVRNFNPGVAYFIRTTECNPDSIFALLHYLDNDVELKTIDSRIKG